MRRILNALGFPSWVHAAAFTAFVGFIAVVVGAVAVMAAHCPSC